MFLRKFVCAIDCCAKLRMADGRASMQQHWQNRMGQLSHVPKHPLPDQPASTDGTQGSPKRACTGGIRIAGTATDNEQSAQYSGKSQSLLADGSTDRLQEAVWDHANGTWTTEPPSVNMEVPPQEGSDATLQYESPGDVDELPEDGALCSQHSQHWMDSACRANPPVLADGRGDIVGPDGVKEWLDQHELGQYAAAFLEFDICGEVLSSVNADDCAELGMTAEDTFHFLDALHAKTVKWKAPTFYSPRAGKGIATGDETREQVHVPK